jgi:hypothetical protein
MLQFIIKLLESNPEMLINLLKMLLDYLEKNPAATSEIIAALKANAK